MRKAFILFVSISILISNSVFSQSKKELRKQKEKETYEVIKKLIDGGAFVFEAEWANSYKGRRIFLGGDGYDFVIKKDSTKAYLPFYGRRFSGGGYNEDGGIKFEVAGVSYDIKHNDKKTRTEIKFKVKNNSEAFDIYLSIFANGNSTLSISSSDRSNMKFDGKVVAIKKKEKKKKDKK